jgi:hypothetical protein
VFSNKSFSLFCFFSTLLILVTLNNLLLLDLKSILMFNHINFDALKSLDFAVLPVSVILGLLMICLSLGGRYARAFTIFFAANALFAYFLYNDVTSSNVFSAFYVWANIAPILSVILVWGVANQKYTFKTAALHYPILALLNASVFHFLGKAAVEPLIEFLPTEILLFWVNALILTIFGCLKFHKDEESKGAKRYWLYLGALILIAFALGGVQKLPDHLFFKSASAALSTAKAFTAFKKDFGYIKEVTLFFAGLMSVPLGYILYLRGSKFLAAVAGAISLGMMVAGLGVILVPSYMSSDTNAATTSGLTLLLFASCYAVFQPFKELMFFGLEPKRRLTYKIAADFVVFMIAASMTKSFIMEAVVFKLPVESYITPFVVFMLMCFVGIFATHQLLKGKATVQQA